MENSLIIQKRFKQKFLIMKPNGQNKNNLNIKNQNGRVLI